MKLTQFSLDLTNGIESHRKTLLIVLFMNCFMFAQVMAQTITGKVVDESGEPLAGANVLVKGTSQGTMTDFNGEYSINVEDPSAILLFSYVGYVAKEVAVAGQSQVNVTLLEDANALQEVTVVGYGTQRKSDITGAVSSVKAKEIEDFALARVDQALQGKTSGVYVLNADASPGGNTLIRIRGFNSINGGNEPLVVVDGLQNSSLDNINPNDIESVEILKDASATAIYGARGANGVVLVTTKRGKLGKPRIEVSNTFSMQRIIKTLPMMSAGEFARMQNLIRSINTADGNVPDIPFTDAEIAAYDAGPSTDAQDAIYGTGTINNTQLSISGGTENLRYLVSGNYLTQDGILLNSGFDRANLRVNMNADITKFLDFGINYSFTRSNATAPTFRGGEGVEFDDQAVNTAARWSPTEPLFDENGNYYTHSPDYGAKDAWNPLASAREPINENPAYYNNFNLYLDFKLLEGLNLKITGGGFIDVLNRNRFLNSKTKTGLSSQGEALVRNVRSEFFQNSNILTYKKDFDKHSITFTGLIEQSKATDDYSEIVAKRFAAEENGFYNLALAEQQVVESGSTERTLISYMGRLNYGFADKYLVTLTLRRDGSSVFGDNNKWGNFPSASVAWKVSEESFIKDAVDHMDLKLRYSWGKTGNQGIAPYQSLAKLNAAGLAYPNNSGGLNVGVGLDRLPNPDLKWETTTQSNFGFDLGLFNNRVTATFDYYTKTTDDLLLSRDLPAVSGVSSILDNIGSIENKGFEITIGGDPLVTKDLRWNTSFNITSNKNKVIDIGDDSDGRLTFEASNGGYGLNDFMVLQEGQPFGTMRGYIYDGVWKTEEDAEARRYGQLPGMAKYRDVNNDGIVNEEDITEIGNAFPDFTWGWTNNIDYKSWNLSFMFIGSQGADLFNQARIRREASDERTSPRALNYWTPENQNTDIPGFIDGAYAQSQGLTSTYNVNGATSRWVEDASFIRLKTVQLAYRFDNSKMKWMEKSGVQNLSLFVGATNLFTITDYLGYDPEVAGFAQNDATLGVDFSVYPNQRTYSMGLKLSF